MKIGVFLARMQPLHNAHIFMVTEILKDCDKAIIALGSANKKDMLRNPFPLNLREEILRDELKQVDPNRIEVFELPDWTMESDEKEKHIWGEYLYYNIVSRAKQKHFTFYYGDVPSIMLSWFPRDDIRNQLTFKFFERDSTLQGLSATKIREAILNNNTEYIAKFCPLAVQCRINELRDIWLRVVENPEKDFSML